jgi:acetyl esterase/lipase
MPTLYRIAALLLPVLIAASATAADAPEQVQLWMGQAPIGDGRFEAGKPQHRLTIHRPAKANGVAVVICPGGGYSGLSSDLEGHQIAGWLNRHGVTGIVLEYRFPEGRPMVPLLDAQQALRWVRSQSATLAIDSKHVGIMGFSAGGHLAATAGTRFDLGDKAASDPVAKQSCRPDFLMLLYPVIMMGKAGHQNSSNNLLGVEPKPELVERFSADKQVSDKTPPSFLAHALDDGLVSIENSRAFYQACLTKKVPTRLLELPTGGHGLGEPSASAWKKAALEWLVQQKIATAEALR